MLAALPDCLFHKIAHHANQNAVLVRLSQSNMSARDVVLHSSSTTVIQCLDTITSRVNEIWSLCNQLSNGPAMILFAYWHILHMWTDPSP
jgi:hypothetical protein